MTDTFEIGIELEPEQDVSSLPRGGTGVESSVYLGVALLVAIELTVIFSLVTSYFYFRVMAKSGWPPPGFSLPDPAPSGVATGLLLASIGGAVWANIGARREQQAAVRGGLALGGVLLAVYVALSTYNMLSLDFDWTQQVYGSLVWTVVGYQYFHGVSLLALSVAMLAFGWKGRFSGACRAPLQAVLLYWVFVGFSSVVTYLTVYVTPHVS